jgi:hypothetical protein
MSQLIHLLQFLDLIATVCATNLYDKEQGRLLTFLTKQHDRRILHRQDFVPMNVTITLVYAKLMRVVRSLNFCETLPFMLKSGKIF